MAKANFYNAESHAMEGAQKIYDEADTTKILPNLGAPAPYVRSARATADTDVEKKDELNLDINDDGVINAADFSNDMVVTLNGVSSGNSLGLDTSRLYDYSSYGYADENNGKAIIKVGLKRRF